MHNSSRGDNRSAHHDVTVIGSGWSGLVSCKYALEEGLTVVALEKRENLGGVWFYSGDTQIPTVMKSTNCTSSSSFTEMSDFPMPRDMGMFPHHSDILKYLHSYADRFNLVPSIRFNHSVAKVEKCRDLWRVFCSSGTVFTSTYLIVATGVHLEPNQDLRDSVLRGFSGEIVHASQVKEVTNEFRGKRVLVVGGGETGSDLCVELFRHAEFTYWSIPRGQHFFRKYGRIVPWGTPQALDKGSSRMINLIAPFRRGKPGMSWVCKWTTQGSMLSYQGHGVPEWRNEAQFFKFFINKSGKVLDLIDYKRLVPKGAILKCNGNKVTFVDGSKEEFDVAILSTGYKPSFPYLPERYSRFKLGERYKFVFDVEDPTIAFVGYVRPIVGSVVGVSELQAWWVARVFSGRVPMSPIEVRKREADSDLAYYDEYFELSSRRLEGLVEVFTYVDGVSQLAQLKPDYWALFKRNPYHGYIALVAPFNNAALRLNQLEYSDEAIRTMQSHRKTTFDIVFLFLIAFLRFFWFDWWLDKISGVKYHIQVSSWWPSVRSWGVVSALNQIWTLPKLVLYDGASDDRDTISAQAKLYQAPSP